MSRILIDTNVIIDLVVQDNEWRKWSAQAVNEAARHSRLVINQIILAEVSIGFERSEDVDALIEEAGIEREDLPWEAAFLAGKAYVLYRRRNGQKRSPLPDFFIGAHAATRGYTLLTRDARLQRTYFPSVPLITPPLA